MTIDVNERDDFLHEVRAGGWRVIVAALLGGISGINALAFYSFGIFATPVAQDFGWSHAQVQSGITASMFALACTALVAGWTIDRIGARKVVLFSLTSLAIGYLALANQKGDPTIWVLTWLVMTILSVGTAPMAWAYGVSQTFIKGRGFALGIALTGSAISAMVAPLLAQWLITQVGWRSTYLIFSGVVLVVVLPVCVVLFKPRGQTRAVGSIAVSLTGDTFTQALRGRRFWIMVFAFCCVSFAISSILPNLVPLLKDKGIEDPALYASLLGISSVFGRIFVGYLLDRIWAPLVALVMLTMPIIGFVMLAHGLVPALAVAMIGIGAGAEFDLVSYLSVRYFGMRSYGRIYSSLWTAFSLAAAVGGFFIASLRDSTGAYDRGLYISALVVAVGAAAFLTLGRYPEWTSSSSEAAYGPKRQVQIP